MTEQEAERQGAAWPERRQVVRRTLARLRPWMLPAVLLALCEVHARRASALGSEALRVYEIRIRVEPGISGYPEQGSTTPSSFDAAWLKPSREAAAHVGEFALTVRESPLKTAIGKLADTLRKRAQR